MAEKFYVTNYERDEEMLRISLVTLSRYQKEGVNPYCRLGRHIYIKKGDIMKAIETNIKYQHRRYNPY